MKEPLSLIQDSEIIFWWGRRGCLTIYLDYIATTRILFLNNGSNIGFLCFDKSWKKGLFRGILDLQRGVFDF